jgi:hypothetical protein
MNDKYIVHKRAEWDRWCDGIDAVHTWPSEIDDAVVIRRQDVFAGPGLYSYANAVQTGIEVLDLEHPGRPGALTLRLERLEEIRDYFAEQAQLATELPSKIPD